jgi:peptidoglycan/xylan/chitin deacetylase (PgdA/CDA1 family)
MSRNGIKAWLAPALVAAAVMATGGAGYFALAARPPAGGAPPAAEISATDADDAGPNLPDAPPPESLAGNPPNATPPLNGADDAGPNLPDAPPPGSVAGNAQTGSDGTPPVGGVDPADEDPDGVNSGSADGHPEGENSSPEVTPNGTDGVGGGTSSSTVGGASVAGPAAPVDCSQAACVALTFDDGPDSHTDRILDVLADKGARATFFVQGYRVAMFPDQLRREVAEGHEIGNHTWNHKNLTTLKAKSIKLQIKKTNRAVEKLTGVTPALVRPPYGSVDDKVKKHVGLPLVLWSVDTRDWETKNVKKILKHIKKETKPGSIILMHDTLAASGKALSRAIDILHEKGYTLVTVSELLGDGLEPGSVHTQG